jgi:trigger factor
MAAKAGDEFVIENVYEAFEKSVKETNQFILNKAGDKEIELENKTVTITLKESKDLVLAEVNEDFFKTIFPNVEINNETELNEYFKTDYEKYFEERTNGQLNHDISHYLMDNIQVDLTDNYIKLLITKDKETNKAPEITQSIRDEVRWVIIENKIMMEDGITVEYDEVVQSAMAAYKRNAPQNENYTDEMLMASIDSFFKDKKENYKKEYDNVMNNKFLAAVLKRANVVEKTITLDEFKAVLKEHEHHH